MTKKLDDFFHFLFSWLYLVQHKKRGIIPQSDLIILRYDSYLLHFHNE